MTDSQVIEGEVTKEVIGEPMAEVKDELRRARELIPIGATGLSLQNMQNMVDFARDMSKAKYSLPDHLQGNVGDCLAITCIATGAELVPYMLAMMTYVDPKTKKLAFMSQAYHALAQRWLVGDLDISYVGEGDDMVCVVRGRSKKDPKTIREHRSPPLAEVKPRRNAEGIIKGSPLWDRKPAVQLAYDTVRDWVRLHCPQATMGVYQPDEIDEYADEMAAARRAMQEQERAPVAARLANGNVNRAEGHQGTAHIDAELAGIAPAAKGRQEVKPAEKTNEEPPQPQPEPIRFIATADAEVIKAKLPQPTAPKEPAPSPQEPAPSKTEEPPKEAGPAINIDDAIKRTAKVGTSALYEKEWVALITGWAKSIPVAAERRAQMPTLTDAWRAQRQLRTKLQVPMEAITRISEMMSKAASDGDGHT